MHVLAAIQFCLIWCHSSSVGAGEMVDKSNSTTNHTIHVSLTTAFYSWKRMTVSKHHKQLILPFWEIPLFELQWQWNCADWTLHGTWICYSVPEAVLVSLWRLYSHHICNLSSNHTPKTAYLLCLWNPWNTPFSSSGTALGALECGFGAVHQPVRSASAGQDLGNIHMWNYKSCEKQKHDRKSQVVE